MDLEDKGARSTLAGAARPPVLPARAPGHLVDGLRAALHAPDWVRRHPDEARLLLLYDRKDFRHGDWAQDLRDGVAQMSQRMEGGSRRWARLIFGREGRNEVRRAQFLISELPVAVGRQHLLRGEPPPPLADRIIRATWRAVLADYRSDKPTRRPIRPE